MNILDLQEKYNLSKEPNVDYWKHQQSDKWIFTHDAVEKIAVQEGIKLVDIKVLNTDVDLVRFLVSMSNPSGAIIKSIGEADRKNCHSQYLGCMAEKRGIDRCVLKLIDAYQYGISSEVEAEDFAKPTYYQKRESHLEKFEKLLKDSYFDGKRDDVKVRWKEMRTFSETELFLFQMQDRINSNGELEHEDS